MAIASYLYLWYIKKKGGDKMTLDEARALLSSKGIHDFKNAFYAHHHIRSEFVEKISIEELPKQLQEDCIAYLEYLKNNPAWS